MTALAQQRTIPAYPLGRPKDVDRYSMTPEAATAYYWIVANKSHTHPFDLSYGKLAKALGCSRSTAYRYLAQLEERGWIRRAASCWRLIAPVKVFRAP